MSKVTKKIENPEVPGLESSLPPPPPPPIISGANDCSIDEKDVKTSAAPLESHVDRKKVENSVNENVIIASDKQNNVTSSDSSDSKINERIIEPFAMLEVPVFPETMRNPYFGQLPIDQLPGVEQPWWVPTNADSVDASRQNSATWTDVNASWTESNKTKVPPATKTKVKFFKRKSECIDPAQDAERVASAQRELSALMKPLKCDLCNAIMNSTLQAKLHYEGKPHQKKVSMFLNQSVKKLKPDDGQVTSTTSNTDWNTYCEVCKTWFTSGVDASQHYAGKKHIRATTGVAKQKTKKPPAAPAPTDSTGRFGIGIAFSSEPSATILEPVEVPIVPPVATPVVPAPISYPTLNWPAPTFRCEPCGVTANRPEQLETHKRGARHMRMMKMNGLGNPDADEAKSDNATQPVPVSIDYSIYRTPSGHYYCAPCNHSFQSENSFAQHIESKKHKTQTNPKQPTPPLAANKKLNKTSK